MLLLWNRLQAMDCSRLTKHVFFWDKTFDRYVSNWSHELKSIFTELGDRERYLINESVPLNLSWGILFQQFTDSWKSDTDEKPKLRTYIKFKNQYETEPYVTALMPSYQRSVLARLRCGILPLEIEVGRYSPSIPEEQRLCKLCNNLSVENETHFLFHCPLYESKRRDFYTTANQYFPGFINYSDEHKLHCIMNSNIVRQTARFVSDIFNMRQDRIYRIN